jgi:monovalent cation/hydrogen antiporter
VFGEAVLVSVTVIVVRLAWVSLATYLPRLLSQRLRTRDPYPGWRNVIIIGWTGLRGGISLAAALALPLNVANGQAFPARNLILVLTFGVILATLVGQGLSLIPLIRFLHVSADTSLAEELQQARLAAANAALARLEDLTKDDGRESAFTTHLHTHYEKQIKSLSQSQEEKQTDSVEDDGQIVTQQYIREEVLQAEREAVILLRDQGHIDDESLRMMENELDLEEQRLHL